MTKVAAGAAAALMRADTIAGSSYIINQSIDHHISTISCPWEHQRIQQTSSETVFQLTQEKSYRRAR
jgi:N-acetylglucosamine-6-phosphate deacetylase